MSYQHTIEVIRAHTDDNSPQSSFSNLIELNYDYEGFTKVELPCTGFVDYIREIDNSIIVISDSDQWCDFGEGGGWVYAVFQTIEDYIEDVMDGSSNSVISDEGFNTFNDCFKSAVFDMLMNSEKFKNR